MGVLASFEIGLLHTLENVGRPGGRTRGRGRPGQRHDGASAAYQVEGCGYLQMYEQFSQTGLPSERRSRLVSCSTKFWHLAHRLIKQSIPDQLMVHTRWGGHLFVKGAYKLRE